MMDTQCSITVYDSGHVQYIQGAFDAMREVDRRLNRFSEGSEVWRINENAGGEAVEVSEETFRVIATAKDVSERSGGAFCPVMGAVSDLWGFGSENPRVPSDEELAPVVDALDISKLELDGENLTVRLADDRLKLDLGAVGKGYATGVAADYLRSAGVDRAIINLGGSLYLLGAKSEGEDWVVGIQDPGGGPSGYFATVEVSDAAVVTSGGYQRNFEADGVTWHHILDPETGRSAQSDLLSASAITDDGALADALSTAYFVLGEEGAKALGAEYGAGGLLLTAEREIVRF